MTECKSEEIIVGNLDGVPYNVCIEQTATTPVVVVHFNGRPLMRVPLIHLRAAALRVDPTYATGADLEIAQLKKQLAETRAQVVDLQVAASQASWRMTSPPLQATTAHFLLHGRALCPAFNVIDVAKWPEGHSWTPFGAPIPTGTVCSVCLAINKRAV